jgi:hypothetical protein
MNAEWIKPLFDEVHPCLFQAAPLSHIVPITKQFDPPHYLFIDPNAKLSKPMDDYVS